MDGFSNQSDKESAKLSQEQFAEFINNWSDIDKEANGWITSDQLIDLFKNLAPPMGFGAKYVGQELHMKIADMRIPMYKTDSAELCIYFNDVAIACARKILEDSLKRRGEKEVEFELPMEHQVMKAWKSK